MHTHSAPTIGVIANYIQRSSTISSQRARIHVGANASYLDRVIAAGGLPVVIPLELPDEALYAILERVDGLLLTGGGDVSPACYHEPDSNGDCADVDEVRDGTEIKVVHWAQAKNIPLFGVCRGHQVVNVALGGTLYTDIASHYPTDLAHDTEAAQPLDLYPHHVIIEPDSRLATLVKTTDLPTNSYHHQAVKQAGNGLVVTAHATDGLIEATELPQARFWLTVQWHPELLGNFDPPMQALFDGLVTAAAAYRQEHSPA